MKEKFLNYFNEIGITTKVLINRIDEIYKIICKICPEEFDDILVEDFIKKDSEKEFICLNFFSKNYCVSMQNFLSENAFIIATNNRKLSRIEIDQKDFDFEKATESSRMNVVAGGPHILWTGKATGKNCEYLKKIVEKYLIPNIEI